MGLGFWSMHFIGMPAFHLPIPVAYDVPLTLLSLVPAILSSALVLVLVRRGHLKGWRLVVGAVLLGGGIAAMHYSGLAAVQTAPRIRYDVALVATLAIAFFHARLNDQNARMVKAPARRQPRADRADCCAGCRRATRAAAPTASPARAPISPPARKPKRIQDLAYRDGLTDLANRVTLR